LLLATGNVSWPAVFVFCFLGVWFGDASLYALARFGGRGWFEKSRWRRFEHRVARSERWFEKWGIPILIFNHAAPGARLPTYLAAGFLCVPRCRFMLVTGVASLVWTGALLFLTKIFGDRVLQWLNVYKYAGLWFLGAGAVIFLVRQLLRRKAVHCESRRRDTVGEHSLEP